MKKTVMAVFAGLMSTAALAGMNNIVVSFSTVGPDTYADGSQVRPGEVYALVWTKAGCEFAGIGADGKAIGEDSEVVLKAARATEAGNCPYIAFQIMEEDADYNKYKDGTWGVYLLDTRRYSTVKDAEGNDVIDASSDPTVGDASIVNGYGVVKTFAGSANVSGSAAVNAATVSVVPDIGQNLKVSNISFDEDNVILEVTGSLSCLRYGLKSGSDVNALEEDGGIRYGKDSGTMTIVRPKKSGVQFFQVNRK